jgi:hypothetical protein
MSVSKALYIVATILFALGGVGSPFVPNAVAWGLFFSMLGFLLGGYHV